MYLNKFYLIIIPLIVLGCNNQERWGKDGVGESFTIKRQKSYNYSEMLSGDLDSTEKIEFDNYKERKVENKEDELDIKNTNAVKAKIVIKEKFDIIFSALYDLYNNFIELFK